MLEKMSTSPPFCLTFSTMPTYFLRRAGSLDLKLCQDDRPRPHPRTHLPEELVRDQESANSSSIRRKRDMVRTVPRSHFISSEHFEEPAPL